MQQPPFVRVTKRSRAGFEDIQFSYVVIQRGARPDRVDSKVGRMGGFGRKARVVLKTPIKELEVHVEGTGSAQPSQTETLEDPDPDYGLSPSEIQARLRLEAYQWPRLIFSPMKKGGHEILDACTSEGVSCPHIPIFIFWLRKILGKIMRLTITKSQGKQAFYDARKSRWGDIFPHPPKTRALVRFIPDNPKIPFMGQDIGKRGDILKERETLSYEGIADAIRENRKKSKREFERTQVGKVWELDEED